MRIALIGDVHANLPALEAVLEHACASDAEQVWNTGDFVGYNAFPEEVVRRLCAEKALSVVGNYDLKVIKFPRKRKKWRKKKRLEKWLAFKWAYEQLSLESLEYLASLPKQRRIGMEGKEILLTHGSPAFVDEPLCADTSGKRLVELAGLAAADLIICGHSHQGFSRRVGGSLFINPGSVGRPDDGDPRAAYAMLEFRGSSIAIRHHRITYDVEAAVAQIRLKGLPVLFEEMLRRGRELDWVLEDRQD